MDTSKADRNRERPHPIDVRQMPAVDGVVVPDEFYTVLEAPARLAGMRRPSSRTPWARLSRLGFRYVVCLTDDQAPYDPSPIEVLHAVYLEDLYGGLIPTDPSCEAERVSEAIDRVVAALRVGDGVIVHCAGGTGRTGTVIGGVLRRFGHPASDVIGYLDRLHRQRGTRWPESSWAGEFVRMERPRV